MPIRSFRLIAPALLLASSCLFAGPAEEFEKLFGRELTSVQKTPDPADDIQLARTLISATEQPDLEPEMAVELLTRAADLTAKHRDGYDTAIQATRRLAEVDERNSLAHLRTIAELRQKIYQASPSDQRAEKGEELIQAQLDLAEAQKTAQDLAGALDTVKRAVPIAAAIRSERQSELKDWITATTAEAATLKKIEAMKDQLAASTNPSPDLARQLIQLLVSELDDPGEARKYTFLVKDSALTERVRLASEKSDSLAASQHIDLGDWYESLAQTASADRSRLTMLDHAETHFHAALDAADASALEKAKATSAAERIAAAIEALENKAVASGSDSRSTAGWIDLLEKADPNAARGATWNRKGQAITVEAGDGRDMLGVLQLPGDISGGYDLQVKFARVSGATVGVGFPVGDRSTSFLMDMRPLWAFSPLAGPLADRRRGVANDPGRFNAYLYMGLHRIDGKGADEDSNPTRSRSNLPDNKSVLLVIKVRPKGDKAQITVSLNGKTVANWAGPIEKLSSDLEGFGGRRRDRRDRGDNTEAPSGQASLAVLGASAVFQTVKVKAVDGGKITLSETP